MLFRSPVVKSREKKHGASLRTHPTEKALGEETRCLGRFGSRRLCSGKGVLLDSELDGGLSSSHVTHIRIAKDQERKGAKGHLHYRDNERRRPFKRDPLICEDLRGRAEGFGQPFGKGSGSARPNNIALALAPVNSGARETGFTPPRVETHPFSKSQPNRRPNPLAHLASVLSQVSQAHLL